MSEEKRMIGSYEVTQSIHIGRKEVVFGVDEKEEYPFLVCYCTYDNPLSAEWVTDAVGSDDYLEAMQIFMERVQEQIGLVRAEQEQFKFDMKPFTIDDCIPDDRNSSIVGKVVIINAEVTVMSTATPPISLYWQTAVTVRLAAEVRRCSAHALPLASIADGKGTMSLGKSSPNVRPNGQRKPLDASRHRRKRKKQRTGRNADGGTSFITARTEIHLFPEYADCGADGLHRASAWRF